MFVSPQLSTGSPAAIPATIGDKCRRAFSAASSTYFDKFVLFEGASDTAAGYCEAMWSCEAALKVAVPALPRGGYLRAAQAGRPRASGSSGGASLRANSHLHHALCPRGCREKMCAWSGRFLPIPAC